MREACAQDENGGKEVRIFVDGVFDLTHYGHMNAFRLARSLGTHLIVGVNSEETIRQCKGPPLYEEQHRIAMVGACKFVDTVVPDCPYIMNKEYLEWVFREHNIDYIVHGDDPCIVNGEDVYATAKQTGRFKSIPRTEGVSTTDVIGRILELGDMQDGAPCDVAYLGQKSRFLATGRLLRQFASSKEPAAGDRVAYIAGCWDMFHPGHVAILKAAKSRCDYLIVGVYGDSLIQQRKKKGFPIMNLNERALSVMGCKFVDDVVLDPSPTISPQMVASLSLSEVLHCPTKDSIYGPDDPIYTTVKMDNVFHCMDAPTTMHVGDVVAKIEANRSALQTKYKKKSDAENAFYRDKYGLKEEP
eukprot:CAMPEP_0198130400 /NCGR_PEP_ID=MMETSP1442-20131203/53863_1 /TAXON_ID= /ORGANISM="Craspedostauros australis, Strain CCMP3328" /LENGTH=357 /DNA_ID=CAMNT_0043791005 /DNA_START=58 /DNA_END=1131 /DNA_ORIENTATION=-